MQAPIPKLCQSCIERGYKNPNHATREYQTGVFYCDDCFNAIMENMLNMSPDGVKTNLPKIESQGPLLPLIYQHLNIPPELQFDSIDATCRNQEKIFNHHGPALINMKLEDIMIEIEQMSIGMFQIRWRIDRLVEYSKKLKEDRRKEKGLLSYEDSKEQYAKVKVGTSKIKMSQEEKLAKQLGMTMEEYKKFADMNKADEKKERERRFNRMAGNCPECGKAKPCAEHPNAE